MNFIDGLLLISEIGCKIGNINSTKFFDAKEFRKMNNISFYNSLPHFDEEKPYIIVNGESYKVGTILKRPLGSLTTVSKCKIEYHYGVVLGTTITGQEMLIEMTNDRNVTLVTKKDFLINKFLEKDIQIKSLPPKDITREKIIERAKVYEFDTYHLLDLNCKIFAEYIVLEIEPPQRVKEIKKFQLILNDMAISMLTQQLKGSIDTDNKNFINYRLNEAKKNKEMLIKAIEITN